MTEWMRGNELEQRRAGGNLGGTMRLGAYEAVLEPGSRVADIYGRLRISERHRHRYEVNTRYRERLEGTGMTFSGMSPDGLLPEIIEIGDHPWYHRRAVPPRAQIAPVRAAPAVPQLCRRRDRPEPAGLAKMRLFASYLLLLL